MNISLEKQPHFGHQLVLARHGETEWSKSGKHTGKSDIPLTEAGLEQAKKLAPKLQSFSFSQVFCSPLQRVKTTCDLCGFLNRAKITKDLLEWDYGIYDGKTTEEIRKKNPNWTIFNTKIIDGESLDQVYERAAHLKKQILQIPGDVLCFSSGHFLRVFAACWINEPALFAQKIALSTASFSILGYEHETPVIKVWNDTSHI